MTATGCGLAARPNIVVEPNQQTTNLRHHSPPQLQQERKYMADRVISHSAILCALLQGMYGSFFGISFRTEARYYRNNLPNNACH